MQNKKEELDPLKQTHRAHKGLNEKLKKRRKQEKEKKKEKKLKKKLNEKKKRKKEQESEEERKLTKEEKKERKLIKYTKKLYLHMKDESDEFFEILDVLDKGGEIEIDEMEDQKLKTLLKKLFKYLGVYKNDLTKEYKKGKESSISLNETVHKLWEKVKTILNNDSDDEEDEDEEVEEHDDDENNKKRAIKNDDNNIISENPISKKIHYPEKPINLAELTKASAPDQEKVEDWKSFLNEGFDDIFKKSIKDKEETKKKEQEIDDQARKEEDEIRKFMKDYDEKLRGKSLLELHMEKKKADKNKQIGQPKERRPFDKEIDLSMGRVDSKRIFEVLNNKDISLGSRFGQSRIEKSFMQKSE